MTDLILHIGPPKTGTTTIQNRVLAGQPNYLGKARWRRNDKAARFRALLQQLQCGDTGRLAESVRAWTARCRALDPASARFILSDEDLSSWYGAGSCIGKFPIKPSGVAAVNGEHTRPAPIVRLLVEHLKAAWSPGRVKVLMVLRNQPDWLASLYSQISRRILDASQRDFESQVGRIIRDGDPYIDWSAWVEDLQGALGHENVCVLLMEEIHTTAFWSRLASFMGLSAGSVEALASSVLPGWNVRAIERNLTWRLRRYTFGNALPRYWPAAGRDPAIRMTCELRGRILEHVAPYNARLAGQLGRELAPLGY